MAKPGTSAASQTDLETEDELAARHGVAAAAVLVHDEGAAGRAVERDEDRGLVDVEDVVERCEQLRPLCELDFAAHVPDPEWVLLIDGHVAHLSWEVDRRKRLLGVVPHGAAQHADQLDVPRPGDVGGLADKGS